MDNSLLAVRDINHKYIVVDYKEKEFVKFSFEDKLAYTKPVSIEYNGNIYSDFSNWTQLYVRVLKILFKENKNILIDLCGKNITGTGRVEIATIDQMDQMIAPKEFADGLYVETNISATDITKKIAGVLSYYKIKVQDFKIYFERKHEQTPSNAVPVKKTKQADSKVFVDADKYRRILLTHYRKGFRLNDKLSVRRFRMQWKSEFDFEVECSDEELCENVMKICIRYGDMAYLPDVMLDEPRRMKLLAYIRKIFSEGKNVIYYESLFKEFSEDFEDGRINNADMLKTYLSHYVADEMYFGKKYIAPDSNVEIDLTEEVRNFLIEADTAVATDEIVSSLSHITRDKVVTVLAGTNSEEFIRNQKGKYFHESIVEFTTDEMIKIVKWINEATDNMDEYKNMLTELPSLFQESALLDRMHGFIKGWDIPPMQPGLKISGWALNTEYFCTVLHLLREDMSYRAIVDQIVEVSDGAYERHVEAVKKLTTAFLKLLFPHVKSVEDINRLQFKTYCLQPAVKMRKIVQLQLEELDPKEYKKEEKQMPTFSLRKDV